MADRVASVMLTLVLVTAGAAAPFAHVHPQGDGHGVERPGRAHNHTQSAHEHGQGAHWHPVGNQTAGRQSSTVPVQRHREVSVALDAVTVERVGVRVEITLALVEFWGSHAGPNPVEGSSPVASNARPNPPPPRILAARAPPL